MTSRSRGQEMAVGYSSTTLQVREMKLTSLTSPRARGGKSEANSSTPGGAGTQHPRISPAWPSSRNPARFSSFL